MLFYKLEILVVDIYIGLQVLSCYKIGDSVKTIIGIFVLMCSVTCTSDTTSGCGYRQDYICAKKVFKTLEEAKKFFNKKHSNLSYYKYKIGKAIDLNFDGVPEPILIHFESNRSRFVLFLGSDKDGYRVIGEITASDLYLDKLPNLISERLGVKEDKFNGYSYVVAGLSHSSGSGSKNYYAFNGITYNFVGGWSAVGEATIIRNKK